MSRFSVRFSLLAILLLPSLGLLPGCHFERDHPHDPARCAGGCGDNYCYEGRCVPRDGGADNAAADLVADSPQSDVNQSDVTLDTAPDFVDDLLIDALFDGKLETAPDTAIADTIQDLAVDQLADLSDASLDAPPLDVAVDVFADVSDATLDTEVSLDMSPTVATVKGSVSIKAGAVTCSALDAGTGAEDCKGAVLVFALTCATFDPCPTPIGSASQSSVDLTAGQSVSYQFNINTQIPNGTENIYIGAVLYEDGILKTGPTIGDLGLLTTIPLAIVGGQQFTVNIELDQRYTTSPFTDAGSPP